MKKDLPDHLCRRDIQGLDEAVLATDYAQFENLSIEEVIDSISAGKLSGVQVGGIWYVEPPPFCEDHLSEMHAVQRKTTDKDASKMPAIPEDLTSVFDGAVNVTLTEHGIISDENIEGILTPNKLGSKKTDIPSPPAPPKLSKTIWAYVFFVTMCVSGAEFAGHMLPTFSNPHWSDEPFPPTMLLAFVLSVGGSIAVSLSFNAISFWLTHGKNRWRSLSLLLVMVAIGVACFYCAYRASQFNEERLAQSDFVKAAAEGDLPWIESLLINGVDVNTTEPTDGATALILASQGGYVPVVQQLIERGADVNIKAADGGTALLVATAYGHLDVAQMLLSNGADLNARRTSDGATALILAAQQGYMDVVQALIAKGADVNAREKDNGTTALIQAAFTGHLDTVQALLAKGADVNAKKEDDGSTALIETAQKGYLDVMQALLAKGADINAKASNGGTALITACYWGQLAVVKALLAKGADITAKASNGMTALDAATAGGHDEVRAALVYENGIRTVNRNNLSPALTQEPYRLLKKEDGFNFTGTTQTLIDWSGKTQWFKYLDFGLVNSNNNFTSVELIDPYVKDGVIKTKTFGDIIQKTESPLTYAVTETQVKLIRDFLATQAKQ